MTTGEIVIAVLILFGFLAIGQTLDRISRQLGNLIGIAHRIRINDRSADF